MTDMNVDSSMDRLSDKILESALDTTSKLKEEIKNAKEFFTVRITVEQFEEAFLPLFTGEPSAYPAVTLDHYFGYVGAGSQHNGASRELAVVDQNGVEVLRIPPLFDNKKINLDVDRNREGNFYEIMGRVIEVSKSIPPKGIRLMLSLSEKRWKELENKEHVIEMIQRWNKVFVFYGKEPIKVEGLTNEELGIPVDYIATRKIDSSESVGNLEKVNTNPSVKSELDLDEEYDP